MNRAGRNNKEIRSLQDLMQSKAYQTGDHASPDDPAIASIYKTSVEKYLLQMGDQLIQNVILPSIIGPLGKSLGQISGSSKYNEDKLTGSLLTRLYGGITGRAEVVNTDRRSIGRLTRQGAKNTDTTESTPRRGRDGRQLTNDEIKAELELLHQRRTQQESSEPKQMTETLKSKLEELIKVVKRGFGLDENRAERDESIRDDVRAAASVSERNKIEPPTGAPVNPAASSNSLMDLAQGSARLGARVAQGAVTAGRAVGRFATSPLGTRLLGAAAIGYAGTSALSEQNDLSPEEIQKRGGFAASSAQSFGNTVSFGLADKLTQSLSGTAISNSIGRGIALAMLPFSQTAREAVTGEIKSALKDVFDSDLKRKIISVFSNLIPQPVQNFFGNAVDNVKNFFGMESTATKAAPKGHDKYDNIMIEEYRKQGFSPEMMSKLKAQVQAESGFNPAASSGKAHGLTQFTPDTAKQFGVQYGTDDASVRTQISGQAKYMSYLLKKYNGDEDKAFAAYNAGPGNVNKAIKKSKQLGGDWRTHLPKPDETLPYINRIKSYSANYSFSSPEDSKTKTQQDNEVKAESASIPYRPGVATPSSRTMSNQVYTPSAVSNTVNTPISVANLAGDNKLQVSEPPPAVKAQEISTTPSNTTPMPLPDNRSKAIGLNDMPFSPLDNGLTALNIGLLK